MAKEKHGLSVRHCRRILTQRFATKEASNDGSVVNYPIETEGFRPVPKLEKGQTASLGKSDRNYCKRAGTNQRWSFARQIADKLQAIVGENAKP
jgi:hypothetical protein